MENRKIVAMREEIRDIKLQVIEHSKYNKFLEDRIVQLETELDHDKVIMNRITLWASKYEKDNKENKAPLYEERDKANINAHTDN